MAKLRDPKISEIFYYFEQHTNLQTGRTMGRKIGVVQEILVKKLLLGSPRLKDSIVYEPRIGGRSGATHKVEFVFFQPICALVLKAGSKAEFPGAAGVSVHLEAVDSQARRAKFTVTIGREKLRCAMNEGELSSIKLRGILEQHKVQLRLSEVLNNKARISLVELDAPRLTIESKRVGAQRF